MYIIKSSLAAYTYYREPMPFPFAVSIRNAQTNGTARTAGCLTQRPIQTSYNGCTRSDRNGPTFQTNRSKPQKRKPKRE